MDNYATRNHEALALAPALGLALSLTFLLIAFVHARAFAAVA